MDPHSIFERLSNLEAPPAERASQGWPGKHGADSAPKQEQVRFPGEDGGKSLAEIAHRDVDAALQLLAEQAQYITGATGAAIALRDKEEMLCRASAGHSAPEVGSQLQVNSGLSGESVRTRETLRCDDAATDLRVNRESCEALGIASVVVMPLVHADEVIGVFELFSDKAHAFEMRDLTALERMGKMVFTALEQREAHDLVDDEQPRPAAPQTGVEDLGSPGFGVDADAATANSTDAGSDSVTGSTAEARPIDPATTTDTNAYVEEATSVLEAPEAVSGIAFHRNGSRGAGSTDTPGVITATPHPMQEESEDILGDVAQADVAQDMQPIPEALRETREGEIRGATFADRVGATMAQAGISRVESAAPIAESSERVEAKDASPVSGGPTGSSSLVASLKRCEACGFPVSEGRQLCLDCEKKRGVEVAAPSDTVGFATKTPEISVPSVALQPSTVASSDEGPQLFSEGSDDTPWLASHKYMIVAIAIAILVIALFLLAR
jgi:putative methionine-R-sulfoxide reductase with GAF domain